MSAIPPRLIFSRTVKLAKVVPIIIVAATVTNRTVVCKRNPRRANGEAGGWLHLPGGQREVIRSVVIADVAYHAAEQFAIPREFAICHVATNKIAEDATEILVSAVAQETA